MESRGPQEICSVARITGLAVYNASIRYIRANQLGECQPRSVTDDEQAAREAVNVKDEHELMHVGSGRDTTTVMRPTN